MAAVLADLVDTMVTYLNSAPSGTWSDLTVGTGSNDTVRATPVMDPEKLFESGDAGLYVVPAAMTYNRSASAGRQSIVQLNRSPVIAVCLSYKFIVPDTTGKDVSTWPYIKKMLNLREEIDLYLLKHNWGWNIANITAESAQEIPLKTRWYLAVTEIEFEGMTC